MTVYDNLMLVLGVVFQLLPVFFGVNFAQHGSGELGVIGIWIVVGRCVNGFVRCRMMTEFDELVRIGRRIMVFT